jgi:hypothetical protein
LLVTDEVAKTLWTSWNPEQPRRIEDSVFRKAFAHMLAEGVRLGFHVNRFRDIARSLPDPVADGSNWATLFEGAIAGQDRCKVRISFGPDRYRAYTSTNQDTEKEKSWDGMLSMMTDGLFYELGIVYPPIGVEADEALTGDYFRVEWNDVQLPPHRGIGDDKALVNDTVDRLKLLQVQGEETVNPANGSECAFIVSEDIEKCEQAGLTTWDSRGHVILTVAAVLRKAAGAFVNRYFVWYCLNALAQTWPMLVDQVKKQVDSDVLVQIIRGLADEEISFRNLRSVLEAILSEQSRIYVNLTKYIIFAHRASGVTIGPTLGDSIMAVADHVTNVRNAMRRYISHKYTRGGNTLVVYLIDPEIEARLGNPQDLFTEEREELLTAIRNEVGNLPPTAQSPVILTTQEIRLRLRREVRHEFPHLAVLSYQELSPDMNIQPIARISSDQWPKYSRDALWSRRYAERVDQSLGHLLDALPARSGARSAAPSRGGDEAGLADFLADRNAEIASLVANQMREKRSYEMSESALQDLLERYVNAYLDLLNAGLGDRLDDLMGDLSRALGAQGTRCSDVLEIPLLISAMIRRLLAERHTELDGDHALSGFTRALKRIDTTTHRVAQMAIDTSMHAKLGRLLQ